MDQRFYWLALKFVPGIGNTGYQRLLQYFNTPENVFQASKRELSKIEGIKKDSISAIINFNLADEVNRELSLIDKYGVSLIATKDPFYPKNLARVPDAPSLLYVKGVLKEVDEWAVSVVGSRMATHYGKTVTERLCADLAKKGITIVSGMARGIDTAAHCGALMGGGRTMAVLGSGIDVIYPAENKRLYERIVENGAVISEFPMGTPPYSQNFPIRNRIISGLSLGVVIVEATHRSGSLITAQLALDQGREVFAVPGSVGSFKSMGTHNLIKQGAKLVEYANDIVEEIYPFHKMSEQFQSHPENKKLNLTTDERAIYNHLENYPMHIDELTRNIKLSIGETLSLLLSLELKGIVKQLPGKMFVRTQ